MPWGFARAIHVGGVSQSFPPQWAECMPTVARKGRMEPDPAKPEPPSNNVVHTVQNDNAL